MLLSQQQQLILDQSDLDSYGKQLGFRNFEFIKDIASTVEKKVIMKLLQTEDIEEPKFFIPQSTPMIYIITRGYKGGNVKSCLPRKPY